MAPSCARSAGLSLDHSTNHQGCSPFVARTVSCGTRQLLRSGERVCCPVVLYSNFQSFAEFVDLMMAKLYLQACSIRSEHRIGQVQLKGSFCGCDSVSAPEGLEVLASNLNSTLGHTNASECR